MRALIILLFAVPVFAQRPTPTVIGGATSTASYKPPFRVSSTGILYVSTGGSAGAAVQRPTPTVVGGADSTGAAVAILTDADGTVRVSCSDCGGSGGLSGSIADTQIAFGVGTAIGGVSTFTYSTTSNAFMLTGTTPRLGVGTFATSGAGALNQELQVNTTSTSTQRGFGSYQFSTDALGGRFDCGKSRGTPSAMTVIVTADVECRLEAWAFDGVNWINSARIAAVSSGTIAATRTPSQWVFSTSTNATPSVITTALTIDSAQLATFTAGVSSQTLATTTGTFATSATVPLVIGGSAVGQSLTLQSTSGTGATDSIIFKGGTNGATTWATIDSSGTTSNLNSFISTTFKSPVGSGVAITATTPTSGAGAGITLTASAGISGNGNGGFNFLLPGDGQGSGTNASVVIMRSNGSTANIITALGQTNAPTARGLVVTGVATGAISHLQFSTTTTVSPPFLGYKSASNTFGTLAAVGNGDVLVELSGRGAASSSAWDTNGAGVFVLASQTHSASNQGKYVQFRVTADSTTTQTSAWRVSSSPVGDLIPESDNTYNIGSASARVAGITAVTMALSSSAATLNIGAAALPAGYTVWVNAGTSGLNGRVYMANLTSTTSALGAAICQAVSGEIEANTNAGGCLASSERFKRDIVKMDDGLGVLMLMSPKSSWAWIDNRVHQPVGGPGTAEEMARIGNGWLATYDNEGRPYSLNDRGILGVTVKSVQELQAEIISLQKRVTDLEAPAKAMLALDPGGVTYIDSGLDRYIYQNNIGDQK